MSITGGCWSAVNNIMIMLIIQLQLQAIHHNRSCCHSWSRCGHTCSLFDYIDILHLQIPTFNIVILRDCEWSWTGCAVDKADDYFMLQYNGLGCWLMYWCNRGTHMQWLQLTSLKEVSLYPDLVKVVWRWSKSPCREERNLKNCFRLFIACSK